MVVALAQLGARHASPRVSRGLLTSKELDPDFVAFNSENRRYHFPRRSYSPFRGQFLQAEPLRRQRLLSALAPYLAMYGYASHNPLAKVDPLGLAPRYVVKIVRGDAGCPACCKPVKEMHQFPAEWFNCLATARANYEADMAAFVKACDLRKGRFTILSEGTARPMTVNKNCECVGGDTILCSIWSKWVCIWDDPNAPWRDPIDIEADLSDLITDALELKLALELLREILKRPPGGPPPAGGGLLDDEIRRFRVPQLPAPTPEQAARILLGAILLGAILGFAIVIA